MITKGSSQIRRQGASADSSSAALLVDLDLIEFPQVQRHCVWFERPPEQVMSAGANCESDAVLDHKGRYQGYLLGALRADDERRVEAGIVEVARADLCVVWR